MTLHDDMSKEALAARHERREERYDEREDKRDVANAYESQVTMNMSTVLMVIVGVLAIIAGATNVWVYSIVQTIEKNSNRLSILETSQMSQDKVMDRFFVESSQDRKEIKERLQVYGDNQIRFMSKLGIPSRRLEDK